MSGCYMQQCSFYRSKLSTGRGQFLDGLFPDGHFREDSSRKTFPRRIFPRTDNFPKGQFPE